MAVFHISAARRRARFGTLGDEDLRYIARALQAAGHVADMSGDKVVAQINIHLAAEAYGALGDTERVEFCSHLLESIIRGDDRPPPTGDGVIAR